MEIGRIRVRKGKSTDFFQTKQIQNIVTNIFQNKIKQMLIYYKMHLHM